MINQNQNGFSQIQVLMFILVACGLAFTVMQFSEKKNQQQIIGLQVEAEGVAKVIKERLALKQTCEANFIGISPGENLAALVSSLNVNDKPIAEVGAKFQATSVYIKSMRILNRTEEVASGLRVATKPAVVDFTSGAGELYLRVVIVKHLDLVSAQKDGEKIYSSKEYVETFPVKGSFYDVKIVSHQNETSLDEACFSHASTLGLTCKGAEKGRCVSTPIDKDGNGTDFLVDAKTGAKVYLAECRYFRDDSPFMECAN